MKYFFLSIVLTTFCGCSGGGTTTGNPIRVSVRLVDQQPFAWWRPIKQTILLPEARAAVSDVFFCFKRLRFKLDENASSDDGNVDLDLGRMAIDPNGTSLGQVTIATGTYDRIEIDLEKECDDVNGRPSVEFTNGNAPFDYETQDRITIKFDGQFTAQTGATIDLNIDLLLDEMDSILPSDNIKNELEAVTGDY